MEDQGPVCRGCGQASRSRSLTRGRRPWPRWSGPTGQRWSSSIPSSWPRTDILRVKLPAGIGLAEPDVPSCRLADGTLLLVKDVPACGYRVLKLAAQENQAAAPTAAEATPSKAASTASSSIRSRRHREHPRQGTGPRVGRSRRPPSGSTNTSTWPAATGTRIVMNPNGPQPQLKISPAQIQPTLQHAAAARAGRDRCASRPAAPWPPRSRARSSSGTTSSGSTSSTVSTKTQTYDKEAVYFAFPFAAEKPTFRYEAPAAIVNANTDMLPGACLDWFTVQHFVEVAGTRRDDRLGHARRPAGLSSRTSTAASGRRKLPMTNGHLYSYADEQLLAHQLPGRPGGRLSRFRFAITSRPKADNVASAQFRLGRLQSAPGQRRSRPNSAGTAAGDAHQPGFRGRAERDRHRHQAGRRGQGPDRAALGACRASRPRPTCGSIATFRPRRPRPATWSRIARSRFRFKAARWPCPCAATVWPRCVWNNRSRLAGVLARRESVAPVGPAVVLPDLGWQYNCHPNIPKGTGPSFRPTVYPKIRLLAEKWTSPPPPPTRARLQ